MEPVIIAAILFLAFLLGSIPTGFLIVKASKGIDIRTVGSGNTGSTNVKRVAGRKAAIITQVIDILKGAIPVGICIFVLSDLDTSFNRNILVSASALTAILGHNFSPFLHFKGGKGVNTTVGAFLLIATIPTAIAVGFYFILRLTTGIVSVGSIALGIVLPMCVGFLNLPFPVFAGSVIAGVLILIQHKDNIARLIRGEEKSTRV